MCFRRPSLLYRSKLKQDWTIESFQRRNHRVGRGGQSTMEYHGLRRHRFLHNVLEYRPFGSYNQHNHPMGCGVSSDKRLCFWQSHIFWRVFSWGPAVHRPNSSSGSSNRPEQLLGDSVMGCFALYCLRLRRTSLLDGLYGQ